MSEDNVYIFGIVKQNESLRGCLNSVTIGSSVIDTIFINMAFGQCR